MQFDASEPLMRDFQSRGDCNMNRARPDLETVFTSSLQIFQLLETVKPSGGGEFLRRQFPLDWENKPSRAQREDSLGRFHDEDKIINSG
jgi:hypothetical protein